jgi:AcrR family transcriptional regulator
MSDFEQIGESPRTRIARGTGREALCRALLRVVARDGFDGVTFRSVAAEAGATHGLASYHFGTRDAMIQEALSWAVHHSLESSHLASSAGDLDGFADDVPRMLSENPEEAVFQFDLLLRALRSPALLDDVRKSYDDYVDAVAQSLRSFGIEDDAIARLVFAALDGLTLQQLLYDDERRTEQAIAALRRLLSGLARAGDGHAAPRRDSDERPTAPDSA